MIVKGKSNNDKRIRIVQLKVRCDRRVKLKARATFESNPLKGHTGGGQLSQVAFRS